MRLTLVCNNIPFDQINTNIPEVQFQPYPKVYYDVVIDDRNIGGLPSWNVIRTELAKFKQNWGKR